MDLWNLMISMMLNCGCASGAPDTPIEPDEPEIPRGNELLEQGGNITLNESIVVDDVVNILEDTVLDLNGYTITMDGKDAKIMVGANLTIKGDTGVFDFTDSYRESLTHGPIFTVWENSTLTIEEGVFLLGGCLADVIQNGTLVINGGHFDMNSVSAENYYYRMIETIGGGEIIITNGNFSSNRIILVLDQPATGTISGGTFFSYVPTHLLQISGNLEITGGRFVKFDPTEYVVDGYESVLQSDDSYLVQKKEEL